MQDVFSPVEGAVVTCDAATRALLFWNELLGFSYMSISRTALASLKIKQKISSVMFLIRYQKIPKRGKSINRKESCGTPKELGVSYTSCYNVIILGCGFSQNM